MPVEMVGGDVDEEADARRERWGEIDLVGRALDDMTCAAAPAAAGRGPATPILPPIATSRPASLNTWAISAVVVDLPLVPVMATNGASGALAPRSRSEELDVADDRNARRIGEVDRPVRRRMRERHAGREHEQLKPRQSASARSTSAMPCGAARSRAAALSSQAATSAPPSTSARAVESPEPPRPKRATLCPRMVSTGVIVTSA